MITKSLPDITGLTREIAEGYGAHVLSVDRKGNGWVIAYNMHRMTVFIVWFLQSPEIIKVIYTNFIFLNWNDMKRSVLYGLSVAALLVTATGGSVWAQYGTGSVQTATPEQLKECEQIGISRVTCNELTILAKRRVLAAAQQDAYGSGTSMLSKTFGEMGIIVGVLAAIFGVTAVAFFAKSRVGKQV